MSRLALMIVLGSSAAGMLGTLTGVGGSVILVPLLVLAMGIDVRYAVGAALVSVLATSSGMAARLVRDAYADVHAAMLLEVATTVGALCGAAIATRLPMSGVLIVVGFVLLYAAFTWCGRNADTADEEVAPSFVLMYVGGVLTALVGASSGALEVATARLGSAPVHVSGHVGVPVVLGVLGGSLCGAYLLPRLPTAAPFRSLHRLGFPRMRGAFSRRSATSDRAAL